MRAGGAQRIPRPPSWRLGDPAPWAGLAAAGAALAGDGAWVVLEPNPLSGPIVTGVGGTTVDGTTTASSIVVAASGSLPPPTEGA